MDAASTSVGEPSATGERELVEILSQAPVTRLETTALRLGERDLFTLAQCPAPPHARAHAVLSALQVVLLSMSLAHQQTQGLLRLSPWPLLRLEVLAAIDSIWRKMWKRLARLRRPSGHSRRKPLANAQVRFVLQQVLKPGVESQTEAWEGILHLYNRVSASVESLACYVLLCAYYSIFPPKHAPSPIKTVKANVLQQQMSRCRRGGAGKIEVDDQRAETALAGARQTWRCGLKRHGRYFLFRASISQPLSSSGQVPDGEYSVSALDCRHSAFDWQLHVPNSLKRGDRMEHQRNSPYANSWTKKRSVSNAVITVLAGNIRAWEASTTMSLLLQVALLDDMFSPLQIGLHSPTKRPQLSKQMLLATLPSKDLRIAAHVIVVASQHLELHLLAVGSLVICGVNETVSTIRRHVYARLGALRMNLPYEYEFLFFLGRCTLPREEETWRPALELLPLVVICVEQSRTSLPFTNKTQHWHPWLPAIADLQTKLRHELATYVAPPLDLDSVLQTSPVEVSLFRLNQSIASHPFTLCGLSTVDTLIALFVQWTAFVQFQQLHDTTSIYQASNLTKKRAPRRRSRLFEQEGEEMCLRPQPSPWEAELLSLPRARFHPDEEYLRPLYASFTFETRTEATLITPYYDEVLVLSQPNAIPIRLAVENEECIIHISSVTKVQSSQRSFSQIGEIYAVTFVRDFSCPLEMLATMRNAFVWEVVPLRANARQSQRLTPPLWLRDVLRHVIHPTWDFHDRALSSWPYSDRYFHVGVPHFFIEKLVETTFWSREIDWRCQYGKCNVFEEILRPKYDALCHSHPPSCSIDSVKFSKFLRECGLQPAFLSVGDVAYLFAKNRAKGSMYEMIYDGFVDSIEWIACRVTSPGADGCNSLQIREFCLEWLIRAPSVSEIWQRVINQWRIQEKVRFMEKTAIIYCAATRIQANWKRFVTRKRLIATLSRMREQRRAAVKMQSVYKMRKQRHCYSRLKAYAIRTQLLIRARRCLRRLRVEHAEFVERMRRRLQRWMHHRLRILRCWKSINAAWLARRSRIQEKRSRRLSAGVFQLETRRYSISLYRAANTSNHSDLTLREAHYELEILEPNTSWFRSVQVSTVTLETLVEEECRSCRVSNVPPMCSNRWKLRVLVGRLQLKSLRSASGDARIRFQPLDECTIRIYRDPLETSLGRLIYQGNVRECEEIRSNSSYRPRFVRLLLRSHDFAVIVYSPESSFKRRLVVTASFVHNVFRVARLHALTFVEGIVPDKMEARAVVVDLLTRQPGKLVAIRTLLRYLEQYGTKTPSRDMMAEEVERRLRERQEAIEHAKLAERQRFVALVVIVQTNVRRILSVRRVQRLALSVYTKSFDPKQHRLVYQYRRVHDVLTYESKPSTLRDLDVGPPVDEWIENEDALLSGVRFFNPMRGVFSSINSLQAVVRLQRWFRRTMWTGALPAWNLRCLTQALLFHHQIQPPEDETDPRQLEKVTNYALQRHVLHHDYKAALALYESALKISQNHAPALVGLAILLIYTCRYPPKQTWARGLQLLDTARITDPNLSISLQYIEQNCFRWAMYLHPTNAHAMGNLALYYQCVREDFDRAELLYRRAIDLDASSEWVVENYLRLQRERTPEGIYSAAGPSKISIWRAQEVRRVGDWRELEDTGARYASAARFSQNTITGQCMWTTPQ